MESGHWTDPQFEWTPLPAMVRGLEPTPSITRLLSCRVCYAGCFFFRANQCCVGCAGCTCLTSCGNLLLCYSGSATIVGHNRVRDTLAMELAMSDPGSLTEPLGLVPSTLLLRLADIPSSRPKNRGCWRLTSVSLLQRLELQGWTLWKSCTIGRSPVMLMPCWRELSSQKDSLRATHRKLATVDGYRIADGRRLVC